MTTKLPLRHLSVRVPWHDAGWNGTVCGDPVNNASCLRLANIHERRDDAVEMRVRGRRLDDLDVAEHPPCLSERATFMADFAVTRKVRHPYQATSDVHRHFRPTPFRIPPYTAAVTPYRWMLLNEAGEIAAEYDVPFDDEAEDRVRELMGFNSAWVQDVRNQSALLDTFISAVEPERSLAFFYAKEVPHIEPTGRVLIGVGWVRRYDDVVEYDYEPGADRPTRSVLWERTVHHSIRPGTAAGGFLLPYHAALERTAEDPSFDPASVVVFAPDEAHTQFSYASEHVSHDQAIASLLAIIEGLQRAQDALGTNFAAEIRWAQESAVGPDGMAGVVDTAHRPAVFLGGHPVDREVVRAAQQHVVDAGLVRHLGVDDQRVDVPRRRPIVHEASQLDRPTARCRPERVTLIRRSRWRRGRRWRRRSSGPAGVARRPCRPGRA